MLDVDDFDQEVLLSSTRVKIGGVRNDALVDIVGLEEQIEREERSGEAMAKKRTNMEATRSAVSEALVLWSSKADILQVCDRGYKLSYCGASKEAWCWVLGTQTLRFAIYYHRTVHSCCRNHHGNDHLFWLPSSMLKYLLYRPVLAWVSPAAAAFTNPNNVAGKTRGREKLDGHSIDGIETNHLYHKQARRVLGGVLGQPITTVLRM